VTDAARSIREFNAGRDPERLALKYRAMRADPFVFLRGTCHLFYERLPAIERFASTPLAWVCGDMHLENFGSYKGDNRLVYFDINDFDEAALAPVGWELVRFATSILVGAPALSASRTDALALTQGFVDAYAKALSQGKARWAERDTTQGLVRELFDGLRGRQRSDFLDKRTERRGAHRVLKLDGQKALPASEKQREQVMAFMREFAQTQADPGFYKPLDVARRIAGTGSLGMERYVVLVKGKGAPDGHYLLDLKRAPASSLVAPLKGIKVAQPRWKTEAHRIVELQRRLQAVPMAFLHPVMLGKRACVLRALQPSEDRVALGRQGQSLGDVRQVIRTMAQLIASAQLRSSGRQGSAIADELIAFGQRRKWKKALIGAAQECEAQARRDWRSYGQAFDDKVFKLKGHDAAGPSPTASRA
jgi:uncharacterized protein (DUF2252 family)